MITAHRTLITLLIILFAFNIVNAQDGKSDARPATALTVTVAATAERVRFTAPGTVVRMRVEIYSDAGETLFDGSSKGNVFDWTLADSAGQRVADGSYLCVVTAKTLSGKLSQRVGQVTVQGKQVSPGGVQASQLSAAQQQAVGPVEENSALTVMAEGDAPATTVIAHDGRNGQVTSTVGALTFRTGNVFSGTEQEQMRLTEEGKLGIGTDNPEARLDVNGMIRARQGFQFSDGSILNLSPKGGLRVTLPSGKTATVSLSPSAVEGTANYIPKFAPDGSSLSDSTIYQDPNTGFIGIGTTTPQHPFVVRRNGGTMGVHSVGELFVDRDDRSRSASLTVGTAGTLKWIFGMPFQSDGFQVYDLTNNVSRFFVDPTNGFIGMGTNSPHSPLAVIAPSASQFVAEFTSNGPSTGINLNNTSTGGRSWGIFSGGTGSGPFPGRFVVTNGIGNLAIDGVGGVGLGPGTVGDPLKWPLTVAGSLPTIPSVVAEFKNSQPETAIIISNTDGAGISWGLFVAAPTSSSARSFSIGDFASNERRLLIDSTGRVGIGTTLPTAKLQVTSGDVYVQTQGSGIILRSTNGANCYRVTVNDAGVLSTALVPCT